MSALDLTNLSHDDAQLPERARIVEKRKWDDNPFVEPLRSTVGEDKGKKVTVPGVHVREVAGGLRDAADKLTREGVTTGVRILFSWKAGKGEHQTSKLTEVPNDETTVDVLYTARPRRRSLDDEQKAEARREGFVNDESKVMGRQYLDWVEAGRPRE